MKRIIICMVAVFAIFTAKAQINQPVTNGDFEEWTTSGFGPLTTLTCNTWNSLSIDLGFLTYNLTDINRTTNAQNGNYAAYIESTTLDNATATALDGIISAFDTSGIINNYFDFYNSIFPGIMMKGNINIMEAAQTFFELAMNLDTIWSGIDSTFSMNDISNIINLIQQVNFSNILVDGMAVQGNPSQLSGYYKYTPGTADSTLITDHAAAFLLGTYFDNTSRTRKISGVGATLFTEEEAYTPFQLDFIPINENQTDTVFIFFLSSLYNGLNGSKLSIDNLSMTITTCDPIENLSTTEQNNSIIVSWNATDAEYYEVEYGEPGFTIGTGVREQTTTPNYTFNQTNETITYNVYVRAVCDVANYSNWSGPQTITLSPAEDISETAISNIRISPNPSTGKFTINYSSELFDLIIFNNLGQAIGHYTNCSDGFSFNIEQNGMYFIEIQTTTFKEIQKVVVTE